jgi:predicted RNase H-like nuclease (RuvC/YqgF family)
MEQWSLIFAALGGFMGLGGLITAISSARQSAKKTELDALKETVNELQDENRRLRARILDLEQENSELRLSLGIPRRAQRPKKALKGLALNDHP